MHIFIKCEIRKKINYPTIEEAASSEPRILRLNSVVAKNGRNEKDVILLATFHRLCADLQRLKWIIGYKSIQNG